MHIVIGTFNRLLSLQKYLNVLKNFCLNNGNPDLGVLGLSPMYRLEVLSQKCQRGRLLREKCVNWHILVKTYVKLSCNKC